MAPGSELRATIGGNTSEPHTFTVPDDGRTELDIEVSPTRDRAPVIAGISLTASGGLTVLVGLFWLALTQCNEQAGLYSGSKTICLGGRANKAQNALIGGSIAVAGVTAVTAGVLLLALRSREPHVVVGPTDDAPQSYGRKETVLGDVASMTSREPATSVGAAFTPLSYGFTF